MHPTNKKKYHNPLSNPFAGQSQKNHPTQPLTFPKQNNSQSNAQLVRIPSNAYSNNQSRNYPSQGFSSNTSQKNKSVAMTNPLRNNFPGRRGSKVSLRQQFSNGSGHFDNRGNKNSQGNLYENYRYLIQEIERKDEKIKKLENDIKETKFSDDKSEINKLRRHIEELESKLDKDKNVNKNLVDKTSRMRKEITNIDGKLKEKVVFMKGQERNMKTIGQLNSELAGVTTQFNEVKGEWSNMTVKDKMNIEKKYKKRMENKLFGIILESAKDNNDTLINKLYNKLHTRRLKADEEFEHF